MPYTIVVAVDARTEQQFRQVWPTWRRKPGICDRPLAIMADVESCLQLEALRERMAAWLDHPDWDIHPWSWGRKEGYTQRERMLTAFVRFAPLLVDTPYWCKIDVDSIATDRESWVIPSWFSGNPAIISRPWGYTKPGHWITTLLEWSASHPELQHLPRLNWPPHESSQRVYRRPRIISQQCFLRTGWTREVAALCPGRLPIPSQDTLHWYVAELQGERIVKTRMQGWTNRRTMNGLHKAVLEFA